MFVMRSQEYCLHNATTTNTSKLHSKDVTWVNNKTFRIQYKYSCADRFVRVVKIEPYWNR